MENDNKIVFLDSEIVDDDVLAPTGALVDGKDTSDGEEELEYLDAGYEIIDEQDDDVIEDVELIEVFDYPTSDDMNSPVSPAAKAADGETNMPANSKKSEAKKGNTSKTAAISSSKKSAEHIKASDAEYKESSDKNLDPYKSKHTKSSDDLWANASINVKKSSKKNSNTEEADGVKQSPAKKATKKPIPDTEGQKEAKTNGSASTAKKSVASKEAKTARSDKKITAIKEDKNMSNDEEKVLIEADETKPQHGKFVIKKTDKGNFVYKLFSSNKRVLAVPGGAYKDISSCKGGIQSVINNAATAPIEDQTLKKIVEQKCPKWEIYLDNKNEFRLRLIASNGNVVAITNDGYTGKDAAKKGIDAIARAAQGASVVRNDDLW